MGIGQMHQPGARIRPHKRGGQHRLGQIIVHWVPVEMAALGKCPAGDCAKLVELLAMAEFFCDCFHLGFGYQVDASS